MAKDRLRSWAALLCVVSWLFAAAHPAAGSEYGRTAPQETAPVKPAPQWQFKFAPYGWFMNVNGDATVRGHTVDVDASFIDLVEDSDSLIALMGYSEARRGPFALFTDVVWADLTFSGDLERGFDVATPIVSLNVLVNANAELEYELTIVQSGVAYEVARWENGSSSTALDLMGSARYWKQSAKASLNVDATAVGVINLDDIGFQLSGSRAFAKAGTLVWVDPVIGARLRHRKASGRELTLTGDIGGFGVGSDFSWQALATYGFTVNLFGMPVRSVVGYRALAVDYSEGGPFGRNGIDAVLHGPVIGASMRW